MIALLSLLAGAGLAALNGVALSNATWSRVAPLPEHMRTIGEWMIVVVCLFVTVLAPLWASAFLTLGSRMRRKGNGGWIRGFGLALLVTNAAVGIAYAALHPAPLENLKNPDPPCIVTWVKDPVGYEILLETLRKRAKKP